MMMISRKTTILAAIASLACTATQSRATYLPINSTVAPNAQASPLAGTTILADTGAQAYNVALNGSSIAGTGREWVVTGFAGNPFGAADLTFVMQVTLTSGSNSNGSPAIVERATNSGFDPSVLTDVGYNMSAGQIFPSSSDRSTNGNVVAFSFLPPGSNIGVGQSSALLIINTNATRFSTTTFTIQDGLTANISGFGPVAVPEPSSLALAGVGTASAVAFGLLRRRRRYMTA